MNLQTFIRFKHFFIFLIFGFVLVACENKETDKDSAGLSGSNNGPINIIVLGNNDFFPDRAVQQNLGLPESLAARIIENLQQSKRFNVLERTALRKVVNEQQFNQEEKQSFLDKTLDAVTDNISDVSGYTVKWASIASDHNDIVKEFQDLGTALGSDYIVFAVLEKVVEKVKSTAIPYSQSDKKIHHETLDARLRLRVINSKTGMIVGATSFRTKVKQSLLAGRESKNDQYSSYDHIGVIASRKILDIVTPARIVSSDPFVINRGANDGFNTGDSYEVVREGKEISDPNGLVLGKLTMPVGSLKVIDVQETISVVDSEDAALQIGDMLKMKDDVTSLAQKNNKPVERSSKDGKLTIAIGKVRFNLIGRNILLSADDYPRIKSDLMVKLHNTNRFDVLERQEMDQVIDEKTFNALMQDDEIEPHLRELMGADYMVFTHVDKFAIRSESKKVPYVDKIQTRHYGVVEATQRIVDSHTGKMLAADKIRINKKLDYETKGKSVNTYSNLIDEFTDLLVSRIVGRIYPIKVLAALPDGTVYINRGEDGNLIVGGEYAVMRPGQELIDPDTGISFGSAEAEIGRIELTSVESARSKAKIVKGEDFKAGDIVRDIADDQKMAKQESPVKVNRPNF